MKNMELKEYIKPRAVSLKIEWKLMKDDWSVPQGGGNGGDTGDNWAKQQGDIWDDDISSEESTEQQTDIFSED
jgi:hypothetical protein